MNFIVGLQRSVREQDCAICKGRCVMPLEIYEKPSKRSDYFCRRSSMRHLFYRRQPNLNSWQKVKR